MKPLKFRTPVKCQNGHKALWYWEIENYGIGTVRNLGVLSNRCDCPKQAFGEGYVKDGEDQQFIGLLDKNGEEIYEGDFIRIWWVTKNLAMKDKDKRWGDYVVKFGEGANEGGGDDSSYFYGYYLEDNEGKQHAELLIEPDHYFVEVIGNITENPELLEVK